MRLIFAIVLLVLLVHSVGAFFASDPLGCSLWHVCKPIRPVSRSCTARSLFAGGTEADVCIVGGGVSGLAAALTAAQLSERVVLLESDKAVGGRVQSDVSASGFTMDRGFAVFIEEYPYAKELLDYDALDLGKFLPGALVKIEDSNELARVADPLRVPTDLFTALLAPVGSIVDKIRLLPLIINVRTKSIEEIFLEPETDTETALRDRWGFSNEMIERFFRPFLEGIFLGPLNEQSSRMFSFVFKMFSEGAATLPAGGIGAVALQLGEKAAAAGADIQTGVAVVSISKNKNGYNVKTNKGNVQAGNVVVATDGPVAKELLSSVDGLKGLNDSPSQVQRAVACLYYSFDAPEPVQDPILILNGGQRDSVRNPVNNVCFPSVVGKGYAPKSSGLCSVTVLKDAMDLYVGRDRDLDTAVRAQVATWFPQHASDIKNKWKLEKIYKIPKAQPAQFGGPLPANIHGGRPVNQYCGKDLPAGLFVCGDHVATATLNGALESGVSAGRAAAR